MALSEDDKAEFFTLLDEALDRRDATQAEKAAKEKAAKEKEGNPGDEPPRPTFAQRLMGG